jgi:DNA-binding NtrC family response regulator
MMPRILVIDNDSAFVMALKKTLEYNKFEVEALLNPLQTMGLLAEREFDCVLLDMAMPGVNGLDLVKKISERYPRLPVIMVSGESAVTIAQEAIKYGAHDFLEKPIETKKLLGIIQNAIKPN